MIKKVFIVGISASNKEYVIIFPLLDSSKILLLTAVLPRNRLDPYCEPKLILWKIPSNIYDIGGPSSKKELLENFSRQLPLKLVVT